MSIPLVASLEPSTAEVLVLVGRRVRKLGIFDWGGVELVGGVGVGDGDVDDIGLGPSFLESGLPL